MDTTEKYIEMCEKADEIQWKWKSTEGRLNILPSYFYDKDLSEVEIAVWLPQTFIKALDGAMGTNVIALGISQVEKNRVGEATMDWRKFMVWLPRQDQLQDMIWGDWNLEIAKAYTFTKFYLFVDKVWDIAGIFGSLEQLWLAFVMMEKYKKVWNGEDWVAVE